VRIRVPVSDPHPALLVAEQALGFDQGKKFLYVLDDNDEVVRREVEVGTLNDGLRVIKSGLKPGERVVLNGLQFVQPGKKVNAQNVAMAPKESAIAAADAPAAAPGATPAVPLGASVTPPASRENLLLPARAKPVEEPRAGVKSAATLQNRRAS
jgi:hypothetical protein